MATIKPTLNITANSANATNSPGPLTMALALTASQTLTVDNVDQFTSNARTTYQAAGFDKIGYEVGFDRQTLIDGSIAEPAPKAKSDGTTLTHTGCWVYVKNTTAATSKHIIAIGHTTHLDASVDSALDSFAADGTGLIGGGSADSSTDIDLTPLVDANTDNFNSSNKRLFSLRAGEWAFFPYDFTGDLYCQATGASQTLEFWRFDRA